MFRCTCVQYSASYTCIHIHATLIIEKEILSLRTKVGDIEEVRTGKEELVHAVVSQDIVSDDGG